jgi:hypothetical protein
MMPSKLFACLTLLCTIALSAQDSLKTIALTGKSTVPANDILKVLPKQCPDVSITSDPTNADYTLEAIKNRTRSGLGIQHVNEFYLTLFDRDGNTFSAVSDECQVYYCHANAMIPEILQKGGRGDTVHSWCIFNSSASDPTPAATEPQTLFQAEIH